MTQPLDILTAIETQIDESDLDTVTRVERCEELLIVHCGSTDDEQAVKDMLPSTVTTVRAGNDHLSPVLHVRVSA